MTTPLSLQRRLTKKFIAQDPVEIELIPQVTTQTPSGGQVKEDGVPRPVQTFKLIPMSYSQRPTVTVNGQERIVDHTLVGQWDCDMAVGDKWTDDTGKRYEIVFMVPGHGYETKGWVECHG